MVWSVTQYKINIAPEAAKEIEDIYLYIAEDSPDNATSWYFAIYDKIQGYITVNCWLTTNKH